MNINSCFSKFFYSILHFFIPFSIAVYLILTYYNNPDEKTIYTVAIDNYYAAGRENFSMLNKIDKALAIYDYDKDKLAIDYIKKMKKPLEIKTDGRITIV